MAIVKMTNRSIMNGDEVISHSTVVDYVYQILTVPAYFYYVESMCKEVIYTLLIYLNSKVASCVFMHFFIFQALDFKWLPNIIDGIWDASVLIDKDLSKALSLLGNLIQLGQCCGQINEIFHPQFAVFISAIHLYFKNLIGFQM